MTQVMLTQIPDEGLQLTFAVDPGELELNMPGRFTFQSLTAALELAKTGAAVQVGGHILGTVLFECARCLCQFRAPLDVPVCTQYLPGRPTIAAGEHPMPADEAENYYYHENTLTLDDLVQQEVLLAMPMSPQCRADCRGLCAQCGKDLNGGPCACAPPPDPRLAVLRDYLNVRREGNDAKSQT